MAVAYTVRDRILARFYARNSHLHGNHVRAVSYLSAEFLMGPQLANNLLNLGLDAPFRQAVQELGLDLDLLIEQEAEPGLGNGGLGRLAACFLESMATMGIPSIGYGIRYEYGIFDQKIQRRLASRIHRPLVAQRESLGIAPRRDLPSRWAFMAGPNTGPTAEGRYRVRWIPQTTVKGVPYNTPIVGYRSGAAYILRLWRSEATRILLFRALQ